MYKSTQNRITIASASRDDKNDRASTATGGYRIDHVACADCEKYRAFIRELDNVLQDANLVLESSLRTVEGLRVMRGRAGLVEG